MDIENVTVHIYGGNIYKLAKQLEAKRLGRGIRTWKEDGKSERRLEVQNLCWPVFNSCSLPVSTVYVEGPPQNKGDSSTELRRSIMAKTSIEGLVPPDMLARVHDAYDGKL